MSIPGPATGVAVASQEPGVDHDSHPSPVGRAAPRVTLPTRSPTNSSIAHVIGVSAVPGWGTLDPWGRLSWGGTSTAAPAGTAVCERRDPGDARRAGHRPVASGCRAGAPSGHPGAADAAGPHPRAGRAGVVRSAPFRAGPTDRPGTLGTHVLIEWDQLRHGPECDRVPSDTWKPIHGRKTSDGQSYSQQKAPESSVSPAHSGPSSPSRSQIWTSTRGAAEPSACMTRPSIRIPAMHPLYSGSKRSRHGG